MSKLIVNFYQNKPDYNGIYQDNKTKIKKLRFGQGNIGTRGQEISIDKFNFKFINR